MIAKSLIRNAWYVAAFSEEIGRGQISGQTIARKPILLWRDESGRVAAFDNRCVHKRMPLSDGRLRNGQLECSYHGLCYDHSGACVSVPAHPDGSIPAQAKLRPYPVIEQDGMIWIWPGDPTMSATAQPPRTPELVDARYESIGCAPMLIPANYLLLIENLLDITHFYPLHEGNIGDIENSRIPVEVEEGEEDGNRYVRTVRRVTDYRLPPYLVDWFGYETVDRIHTHCMMSPGLTRVEMQVAPPGKLGTDANRGYVLYHTHTPIDEVSHFWRWRMNCIASHRSGGDPNTSVASRIAASFPDVADQDRWALEKQQRMFDYADDGYSEVYLRTDKALRRARQIFASMEEAEAATAPRTVVPIVPVSA
jgi:phenylpropionate dioxygenase-like ring-hydroxylating dioxygenase large terminal subunit